MIDAPAIVVKIYDGLGNQMFQYAFGRYLSVINKCALKLDLSSFRQNTFRKYQLHHFSITENIATDHDIEKIRKLNFSKVNLLKRKYLNTLPLIIEEKSLAFTPRYLKARRNTCLQGYWQSESYFKAISSLIKNEFIIKTPPSAENAAMLAAIESGNSISLHIRRGDYVNDEVISQSHGSCPLS